MRLNFFHVVVKVLLEKENFLKCVLVYFSIHSKQIQASEHMCVHSVYFMQKYNFFFYVNTSEYYPYIQTYIFWSRFVQTSKINSTYKSLLSTETYTY